MGRGRRARPVPGWWAEIVDGFVRSLRRRNRRPNTLKSYRGELDQFGAWLAERGVTSLAGLRAADLEAWQDDMLERDLTPRSQMVRISALRGLLKWCALQELELSSPALWLRLESPRIPPLDPRPIPRTDLELILRTLQAQVPRDIWQLRTRALFYVMFSSGARIAEALSLKRGSISPEGARVIQKGGRPHTLLMSELAIDAVREYETLRTDDCPMMFASLFAGHQGEPLGKYEAQVCWNRLCRQLKIGRFTHHRIRHSCATSMHRRGIDLIVIAKQLGHRSLAVLQQYTMIDIEDRQQAVAALDGLMVGASIAQAIDTVRQAIS